MLKQAGKDMDLIRPDMLVLQLFWNLNNSKKTQINIKMCELVIVEILEKCVPSCHFTSSILLLYGFFFLLISENDRCQGSFVMHILEGSGREVTLL